MGMGVWIGPCEGVAWERWLLHTAACATVERRWKAAIVRVDRAARAAGLSRDEVWDRLQRLDAVHPFPPSDAPEAELRALADAYPAALQEYRDLFALVRVEPR